nr:glycosyltransferase [Actinomyces sp.]
MSIVIPFYGDPAPAQELISRLQQDHSPLLHEIIVSDDASPTAFPHMDGVIVTRRDHNGGFAQAVNSGASLATGDLLLILNSDLHLCRGFLDDLITQAQPWMPAMVSVNTAGTSTSASWPGRHFPNTCHAVAEWLLPLVRLRHLPALHEAVGHDTRADGSRDMCVDWVVGALMLLPTQAFRAVGGLDESFYMNSEEVDLQRRLRVLGLPSVILSGLHAVHDGGGSSAADKRVAWMMDGRRRYLTKWRGRTGLAQFEAAMLAATGVNLVWNTIRRAAGTRISPWGVAQEQCQVIRHPEQWVPLEHRAPRSQRGPSSSPSSHGDTPTARQQG